MWELQTGPAVFILLPLWLMYEYSGDSLFRDRAEKYTATLESQKNNTGTHDLGFMMYLPYGNGLRATGNEKYPAIIQQSAISLGSRYNANVGGTRSWDFGNWQFPIIIDNMMNLELLFWATRHTGDSTYYNMAVSHADITLRDHFRDDYSSYHLVDYSKTTGQAIHKQTFQGYNDESSWARGQAWGLYGYVMCYRETGLEDTWNMQRILPNISSTIYPMTLFPGGILILPAKPINPAMHPLLPLQHQPSLNWPNKQTMTTTWILQKVSWKVFLLKPILIKTSM
jgi:hypothetical protein